MNPPMPGDVLPDENSASPFTLRHGPGGVMIVCLAPAVPFETFRTALRELLGDVPARFKGTSVRLDLGNRDLELFDLRRILSVFKEHHVEVVGLHCTPTAVHRYAERELKLKVHVSPPVLERASEATSPPEESPTEIVSAPAPELEDDESEPGGRLLTLNGTVRSGAVVRFHGDIQVFGDVNPGAQLIATGNISVLGALKGLACAGARGDDAAVVFALDMRPAQIRIGKVIQIASGESPERIAKHAAPEIAWLSNGSIVIEPYRGRNPTMKEPQ